ncbi:lariat debranching enzyme [Sphaerodactylus townsendi]|uniref:Lariat debranching enzyme n=1 Tax=Sphaerodactylus townsendi TaxID=933632 RepID=A0ACB8FRA5_9SAUR|nr:lariat debranching enzyme [Sphaerodactylus townsendi]
MKVAVTGCCHGALDKMYETLALMEQRHGHALPDLLLCTGDFQAVRDSADLQCMAVPPKYRQMGGFAQYYSGEKKAPVLTIFIGGNHEASNHLQELPYGGWVAPNIYYLGYAGVVRYRGVRIGGISGIFKSHDYKRGHFECPPYNQNTLRSVYHVRNIEVFKLKQLKQPMDIFMSHDWPRGIYHYGNKNLLLKKKSFFQQEVEDNTLGSPAASELLQHLKPTYWFAAHLHVKFAAIMQHEANDSEQEPKTTKFLALDKCLPHRDFLQIVEIKHDPSASDSLEYDPEWLGVLKATNNLVNVSPNSWNMPENNGLHAKWDYSVTEEDIKAVLEEANNDLRIPQNFSAASSNGNKSQQRATLVHRINPQTTEFCARFGLNDINSRVQQLREEILVQRGEEEEEEEEEVDSTGEASDYNTDVSGLTTSVNPDEIILDEEVSGEEEPDDNLDQQSDATSAGSDLRRLPSSMNVSSDDGLDSAGADLAQLSREPQEGEEDSPSKLLKRTGIEGEEEKGGKKKIKRRNQAIYASQDEDEVE